MGREREVWRGKVSIRRKWYYNRSLGYEEWLSGGEEEDEEI